MPSHLAYAGDDVRVSFNGEFLRFEVPPIIRNDRVFVPVRFVLERVQATVDWDNVKREVLIRAGSRIVVLTIDKNTVLVDGQPREIDVAPFIYQDRTMVPLRFVSETFGLQVDWDAPNRTVLLNTAKGSTTPAPPAGDSGSGKTAVNAGETITGAFGALKVVAPSRVKVGDSFTVKVALSNVSGVKAAAVSLRFDPTKLEALDLKPGVLSGLTARNDLNNTAGTVEYASAITGDGTYSGDGTYFDVTFKALAKGEATLRILPDPRGVLWGPAGNQSPLLVSGTITITE
jgi:hypothetical protein